MRPLFKGYGMLIVIAGCNAGPEPRDASNAAPLPLETTSAQVTNIHAVTEVVPSPEVLATLDAPARTPGDRALDARRQAGDLLTYLDVTPGMRVAQLGAGGGHLTELLALSVGASGLVFAQNPPSLVARAGLGDAWNARLARPVNAHVVRVDREFGAPLPPSARGLDLVYVAYFYRDLPSIGVDRRSLLASAWDALRPGGRLVVIDRATPQTTARLDLRAMHIEESRNARYEIERSGFRFTGEGRFLRASTVTDDWNRAPTGAPTALETQDRFFLSFVK